MKKLWLWIGGSVGFFSLLFTIFQYHGELKYNMGKATHDVEKDHLFEQVIDLRDSLHTLQQEKAKVMPYLILLSKKESLAYQPFFNISAYVHCIPFKIYLLVLEHFQ